MTRIPFSSSALAIVAISMLAAPISLAAQGAHRRGTASAQGQARPRSEPRGSASDQAPPAAQAGPERPTDPPRGEGTPRVPPSRRLEFPNADATAVPRPAPRVVMPQVVVPQVVQPHGETLRPNDHPAYRPDYRSNYQPDYRPQYQQRIYRPPYYRAEYRPYYRPYYSFRPRVRLGLGVWIGYPVNYPPYFYPYRSYPYIYEYPYPNTYPYPSASYPAPGSLPGTGTLAVGVAGGLSFEITPPEAGVYVDGQYVGAVGQFTPNQPPLSLASGRRHVEIREPGFEIIAFDVDILPGQVIPYRGDLRRF